jgi:hypothetical protein
MSEMQGMLDWPRMWRQASASWMSGGVSSATAEALLRKKSSGVSMMQPRPAIGL